MFGGAGHEPVSLDGKTGEALGPGGRDDAAPQGAETVEHLIKTKDPALIAEVVKELEAGTLKRESPPAPPKA
jgi:hypothetical protein